MRIWTRYLWNQLSSTFLLFFLFIFCIYTLVDLSIHGVRFFSQATLYEVLIYYGYNFAIHLYFFLPLTFLLSSLKTLLDLSAHNELVALQMAGLSQKRLLIPFFCFATLLTLFILANFEWISPLAQQKTHEFQRKCTKKQKKERLPELYNVALEDGSELIYQDFDSKTLEFSDVFWLQKNKEIWHMKFLTVSSHPEGRFVDHFTRNSLGKLEKTESFEQISFPDLIVDPNTSLQVYLPLEHRKLSTLCQQSWNRNTQQGSLSAHLHYKLATPCIHFCILLLIGPFVFRFRRDKPLFLIVALSLFAFVSFMIFLEAMLILGENQVIPGFIAIWGPFLLLFAFKIPRIRNYRQKRLCPFPDEDSIR